MIESITLLIFAYLLGSISSAILLSKIMGFQDPRSEGSKNPGATNVLRIAGKKAAFLTLLYANVLDRTPDDAGFAFWEQEQAQGLSRAEMLQYFSESDENFANVAAEIDAGIFYL